VWADLGDGVADGICLDVDATGWYGDVPTAAACGSAKVVRSYRPSTSNRGCFACMLGGPDNRTLFMMTAEWRGPKAMADAVPTGQVVTTEAPPPRAGWP
jgi:sugar lactone lactonase YvrE